MPKSPTFAEKLDRRLSVDPTISEINQLLTCSRSPNRFDSQAELQAHLTEGAQLNVNVLGARALSVPCGEYLVWTTDAGHTMLVPIEATQPNREVYPKLEDAHDVHT